MINLLLFYGIITYVEGSDKVPSPLKIKSSVKILSKK